MSDTRRYSGSDQAEDPQDRDGHRSIFRGGTGLSCEAFIRHVRARAFDLDKPSDNKWQAAYASTCLEDQALRWYEALDPDTQEDWALLRRALLAQFPARLSVERVRGKIKVLTGARDVMYIGLGLDSKSMVCVNAFYKALPVAYNSADKLFTFKAENENPKYLFVDSTSQPIGYRRLVAKDFKQKRSDDTWFIGPDSAITVVIAFKVIDLRNRDPKFKFTVATTARDKVILLVRDHVSLVSSSNECRLIFEPF